MLDTSKRHPRIGSDHAIDKDHSRFYFMDEHVALSLVLGPRAGAQSEGGIIGHVNGVCHTLHLKQGGYGAEELVIENRGARGNVVEHRGFEVVTGTIHALSAQRHTRAHGHGLVDLLLKRLESTLRGKRPQFGGLINGIADSQGAHSSYKLFPERLGNALVNDKSLGSDARLPVIDDPGLDRGLNGAIQIRAGHDDERITSSELKHRFLDGLTRGRSHASACTHAAGKSYRRYTRIGNHVVNAVC